jgi:acetylornithine deacetylase/succinyl-diaminopimelate desuccinylase-like protein
MHAFAAANRELLRADLVITSDGPVDESGRSTINFGNRGVVSFELRATGANRDLHSGNWGGVVPNPIWTLVHLLQSMKNDRGVVTIDGFYDNVRTLDGLEAEALSRLDVDLPEVMRSLNLQRLDQPEERGFFERLMSWPTFTINGFHGGYGGPGSKTVLPHEASVKCDIRLVDAQTADEIYEKVAAHVSRHAPEVELIRQGSMDPSKTPIDSPFTAPISRALEVVHGESPILEPSAGGSLPNYVFTKLLNMPAFGVPYANPDESNHAPNENLELDRFIDGIKTGAAMITFIGAMRE